jgi:endonuclease-3
VDGAKRRPKRCGCYKYFFFGSNKTIAKADKIQKAKVVCDRLSREYPGAECALHHSSPEQLLFATILSAQCTDERVNQVTPTLFAKYPDSQALAKAKVADVEKIIFSTGFYKNKAKNLVGCAQAIQKNHKGELPRDLEQLTALPGVGRKTANVLLGNAFGIPGLVVDTHVKRLSNLIGLTKQQDPVKIELELMDLVEKKNWTEFSHWLILHGRKVCIARRPRCENCVIRSHCDFGKKSV